MEQEEKDLVLRDLCERLPYKVKVSVNGGKEPWTLKGMFDGEYTDVMLILELSFPSKDVYPKTSNWQLSQCKPYLRPLSSMTEEEWRECVNLGIGDEFEDSYGEHRHLLPSHRLYDWLNAHHFDYRGLIEKGLAISTEEFNPYKD